MLVRRHLYIETSPTLFSSTGLILSNCGLTMPYGIGTSCQHWFRSWLVAWWHQVITCTNIDISSVEFCGIHLTKILQKVPKIRIHGMSLNNYTSEITAISPMGQWVKVPASPQCWEMREKKPINIYTVNSLIQDALNPKTWMFLISSCSCHCPIHWSQVLGREWRCTWYSPNRRCSNHLSDQQMYCLLTVVQLILEIPQYLGFVKLIQEDKG